MTRPTTAARDWIERAAQMLNRDPAATERRLELIPAAMDRAASLAPRIAAEGDPADRAELAGRLERIRRAVRTWHEIRRADPELAEVLESTRPAIEAAERLIAAAARRTEPEETDPC